MESIVSHYTKNIWKVKWGSGGASPPDANGMKRSRMKWKLLLFDESDFFSFEASLFLFSFNKAMLFITRKSKNVYFLNQTRLSNGPA